MIIQEKSYHAWNDDERGFIFQISKKEGMQENPILFYDNGEHALLCRKKGQMVILDYIGENYHNALNSSDHAYIVECDDGEDTEPKNMYRVPVSHVDKIEWDDIFILTKELAEYILNQNKKKRKIHFK